MKDKVQDRLVKYILKHGRKDSQETQVLQHMVKHGNITPVEALEKYQCFRLASRINDLRSGGVEIVTDMIKMEDGKRYAVYRLGR
jgi:hypothetical protein